MFDKPRTKNDANLNEFQCSMNMFLVLNVQLWRRNKVLFDRFILLDLSTCELNSDVWWQIGLFCNEYMRNDLRSSDQQGFYLHRWSHREWWHSTRFPKPIELDPNRFDRLAEYSPAKSYFASPLLVYISTYDSERQHVEGNRSRSLTLERDLKPRTASRRSSMRVADCRRSHRRSIYRKKTPFNILIVKASIVPFLELWHCRS